jgi:eukaryotic-like serine/threonine-protein kinase
MSGVSRERWQALSPYLDTAMDLSGEGLAAWLDSVRETDPALAADLLALLDRRDLLAREQFLENSQDCVPPPPSLVGSTIGPYTITALAGQGGMGTVWLAERSDGRFQGRVAVKLLNISLVGGAGAERFKREGNILARLNHPSVARLIDAGMSPSMQPYLVLEYVEGKPIDSYCAHQSLSITDRIRLFLDVLDAVAHAHANLIVHRDIKPSNVLVDNDGRVKLLDFGIAKLLEIDEDAGKPGLTVDGGRALTPEYAAPEQVTGNSVTTATDVYALGVLLYVLIGGRHPAGPSVRPPSELLKFILDKDPPRVSDVVGSKALRRMVRGDLDNIVAKALRKNPKERYASVEAFADDLRRHFSNQPVSARADTWRYRSAKFARRHATGIAVFIAVLATLAVIVSFYTIRLARERDRAQLEAQKATQVGELLAGLLMGADPYGAREKRDPTVRELLDAGAERVRRDLNGQPAVQVQMLTVLGRVYQRLGEYDKAQSLLEDSLSRRREGGNLDQAGLALTLNDLGVLLRERGRIDAAVQPLEEALTIRRTGSGSEPRDVAVTLVELGRVYVDQGKGDRAEPLFREALAMRLRLFGEDNSETATSMSDLALLLWQKGELLEAEPLFRRVLAISRRLLGPDHPDVGSALNNLALIAFDRGDFTGSETLFREALAIDRRSLGNTHPDLGSALNNLAHPLRELGKFDEATELLREALRISSATLEPGHPRMAMFSVNLARIHLARGAARDAEPLLRDALASRLRTYPETDWRVGSAKSLLGASLVALHRYPDAEPLLLDAERVLKHIPGPQGREAKANLLHLATLYEGLGDSGRASGYRSLAAKY